MNPRFLISLAFVLLAFEICAQHKFDITLDAKVSSSELGKKINVSTVSLFKNGKKIDSTVTQYGKCKFTLHEGSVYKVLVEKTGYASKFLLLETSDIPPSAKPKQTVKIEVALFKIKPGLFVDFLDNQAMGIARYNSAYRKMKWDDDYTRIMEEKIIEATIDYAKRKKTGQIK